MEEKVFKNGKLVYEKTKDGEIRKYNKRGNLCYKENKECVIYYSDEVTIRRSFIAGLILFITSISLYIVSCFYFNNNIISAIAVFMFMLSFFVGLREDVKYSSKNGEDYGGSLPF